MAESDNDSNKIPVTVLTGFLGSGKTTLLNHILDDTTHGLRFAIIENEFGEVGVDERILSENSEPEVIEVMNGCICCTVRGDLVVALNKLYKKISMFDAVIIETTGLADPAPVAQTFFLNDEIQEKFYLDGIITVADSKYIVTRLDEERPEGVENEAVEQVAFADRILLNKLDLIEGENEKEKEEKIAAIEARLKKINPAAEIVRCQYSKVEPKKLLNLKAFSLDRVLEMDPEFLSGDEDHEHDPNVTSVSCQFEGYLNQAQLESWIRDIIISMGANLYRYKGLLSVAGSKQKFIFQGVGMLFNGTFSDVEWGDDEKRECRFVFIGRNLDREELTKGFMECKCEEKLRFEIGTKVIANVGKWAPGKIIRLWDDGNPYRIELEDKDKTNIWAPMDTDTFVKKRD